MVDYSRQETAERAGVALDYVDQLVELGILKPSAGDRFSGGDVRRTGLVENLARSGMPLDGLGTVIRSGDLSLDFLDNPLYERFAALTSVTFQELSDRTGIPVDLLMVVREAVGSAQPRPDDLVREDEMEVVPFLAFQVAEGLNVTAIERYLRVIGDSLRRVAEQQADWWGSQVIAPLVAKGVKMGETANVSAAFGERFQPVYEQAFRAIQRAQEARAWTAQTMGVIETVMTGAGLYSPLDRPPAMCFFDITGYTRLTQERGDEAAAELAGTFARMVQRTSIQYAGRPVKWLGDGVMFYFAKPGPGVLAALEMVDSAADAGLPPAHVGLHAGPVLYQEGDYYGQTVNVAARIADYARPGEVLVSQAVVDASEGAASFTEIGPVELKGLSDATLLHVAHRT